MTSKQKLLEIIGDPDAGLHLKKEFKAKLEQKPSKRISHEEILRDLPPAHRKAHT
jgi:hypothetical protein